MIASSPTVDSRGHRFGLLGHPLCHSLSPALHGFFLEQLGVEGTYELFDTPPERLGEAIQRLRTELDGFNCTIPHKQAILPYLDVVDETASRYGAVNTVRCGPDGRLEGFNSDGPGFRAALAAAGLALGRGRALVVGAGGVARMLAMEAALAGDEVWIAARTQEKAADLCADVERALEGGSSPLSPVRTRGVGLAELPGLIASGVRFSLLLQATPVGMWPDIAGLPVPVGVLDGVDAVFDTIYNPLATRLVLAARRRGIPASGGLGMLVEQAAVSFRLWNPDLSDPLPRGGEGRYLLDQRLRTALLARSPFNLVLTGFMGSGKSTVGKVLARELDADFVDLDALVEARAGRTVPEIFAERGEAEFRRLEQEALRSLDEPRRLRVVATGGGALLTPESAARVHDGRGLVVLLDASIHAILKRVGSGEGRPLLSGPGAEERARELMLKRRPAYLAAADAVVMAGRPAKQVARSVRMALGLEDGPSQGGTK